VHAPKLTTLVEAMTVDGDGEKGQESDEFELHDGREDFDQGKSAEGSGTRPKEDS